MKIQCDVCEKDEASLFCVADEAALCAACDYRVHHANKLAGKHQRFSLHQPSPKQTPLCDICQERRALLFCQQDRAILCSVCDIPIHKANEHTQKHTRFLLTGIKLSATSSLYSASSSPSSAASSIRLNNIINKSSSDNAVSINKKNEDLSKSTKPACLIAPTSTTTPSTAKAAGTTVQSSSINDDVQLMMSGGNLNLINGATISASRISEYLEMLPGWHAEDFLDSSSSPSPYAFSMNGGNEMVVPMPLSWDHAGFQSNIISASFPTEKMGFSAVPQVQVQPPLQLTQNQYMEMAFDFANGFIEQHSKEFTTYNNNTRKGSEDNSFAVPQIISPHSSVSKRSTTFY